MFRDEIALVRVDVKRSTAVPEVSDFPQARRMPTAVSDGLQYTNAATAYCIKMLVYLPSAEFLQHPLRPLGRGSANKQRSIFNKRIIKAVLTFKNTKISVRCTEI